MRNDRGIEQRSRFEGVLVGEIGSEQEPPFIRQRSTETQPGSHLLETPSQELPDLHVPIAELGLDLLQQCRDLALRKRGHHGGYV